MAHDTLKLPTDVYGPVELSRLSRELDEINEAMLQLKLRKADSNDKLPKISVLMDQLAKHNSLNLAHEADRLSLAHFLTQVKAQAPVLHFSFASDPSPLFLDKLLTYLRKNIHPLALITIGLQPSIGAGCILRTTNRYFDMSLKQNFKNKRGLLIDKLIKAAQPAKPAEASP